MDPSVTYLSVELRNQLIHCSLEELEELAKFKQELLQDKRLWRARPVEMKGKEHELNVSSYEIWKRKYQLVLVEMKAKFTKNEESN